MTGVDVPGGPGGPGFPGSPCACVCVRQIQSVSGKELVASCDACNKHLS